MDVSTSSTVATTPRNTAEAEVVADAARRSGGTAAAQAEALALAYGVARGAVCLDGASGRLARHNNAARLVHELQGAAPERLGGLRLASLDGCPLLVLPGALRDAARRRRAVVRLGTNGAELVPPGAPPEAALADLAGRLAAAAERAAAAAVLDVDGLAHALGLASVPVFGLLLGYPVVYAFEPTQEAGAAAQRCLNASPLLQRTLSAPCAVLEAEVKLAAHSVPEALAGHEAVRLATAEYVADARRAAAGSGGALGAAALAEVAVRGVGVVL